MSKKYTKDEVDALLNSVEAAFAGSLQKSESAVLAKSEEAQAPVEEIQEQKEEPKAEGADIEAAFRELDKDEQKAILEIVKKVCAEHEEAAQEPQEFGKSEEFETLKKSQEDLTKENEDLKKSLATKEEEVTALVSALQKRFAKVPPQKSVTEVVAIRKSEEEKPVLTREEITKVLSRKVKEPTLTKSDREAINSYYKTGSADITKIQHLLK